MHCTVSLSWFPNTISVIEKRDSFKILTQNLSAAEHHFVSKTVYVVLIYLFLLYTYTQRSTQNCINPHLYTSNLKTDFHNAVYPQVKASCASPYVFVVVFASSLFLIDCNLFFSAFAVLKIDAVWGSNYPSHYQLHFQCIFSKMSAVYGTPQIACLAEVLAQHFFLPQACHLQWSLTFPTEYFLFAFTYVSQILSFFCTLHFN